MGAKLCAAGDPQIMSSNAGKQFFTCKHNKKTLGKVISISQSVPIKFMKLVWKQSGN